ncbi:hypothetical protein LTS08_003037 [Lithohypha guttulata]|nr:hypothetical protein LTS08_003037 [Lithohypha guttulata]
MSSRKSSASIARSANNETASTADLLVFQGNRVLRPDRQPTFPPPVERQKDEGFVKFLKKHSSPTHNRITAGGRIVPMEPRSPPPFSLPSNITNCPQAQSSSQPSDKNTGKTDDNQWTLLPPHSQDQNDYILQNEREQALQFNVEPPSMSDLGAPHDVYSYSGHSGYGYQGTQMAMGNVPAPMVMPSPVHTMYSTPQAGGPVMHQSPTQQILMGYQHNGMPNMGMGVSLVDQYNADGWPVFNLAYAQPMPPQQVMPPQQMLAAYEQHYASLDQQLKDIDRHRAMHHLDARLAAQRKVIVQQRSDAKDTIKEFQVMLGLRRQFNTSQDSWDTGFNVDAPAYIPRTNITAGSTVTHKPSFDIFQDSSAIEKPRLNGQKRVIPIVAPPERRDMAKPGQNVPSRYLSEKQSTNADGWAIDDVPGPANTESGQDDSYGMGSQGQLSLEYIPSSTSDSGQRSGSSSQETSWGAAHDLSDKEETKLGQVVQVIPASNAPPVDITHEYRLIHEALQRPKNVSTQVRVLDGTVMNVRGQEIPPCAFPEVARAPSSRTQWPHQNSASVKSIRDTSKNEQEVLGGLQTLAIQDDFVGKENMSIAPRVHQKAATDAFLSQFNAVEENMAMVVEPETQSLRTASNEQNMNNLANMQGYHQPSSGKVASRENMSTPNAHPVFKADWNRTADVVAEDGFAVSPDTLNNKGYSMVSVQNVHAVGSLPNNFDGAIEARQSVRAQLASATKARSPRSPRLIRRLGGNGGAWYGPYCRGVAEKAFNQNNNQQPAKPFF